MGKREKFRFKPNSIQIAKWLQIAAWQKCHFGQSGPKEVPKRHPPHCLGLNQVAGARCCPSCWGWAKSCIAGQGPGVSPDISLKRDKQGKMLSLSLLSPPELLKFLWLDPCHLSVRKCLDRNNSSQCSVFCIWSVILRQLLRKLSLDLLHVLWASVSLPWSTGS